ncbi:oligopeptide/dipeptide ABC transporter ATP-binding protein [Cystobacter fuscus]|uniref:oligopeptide/dipeptide ABC transporter ATP-binding protein n=1 Tax=Cystobacter fuscus TaxID=43 RepID=UPI002B2BC689|nr:ATP-binding cassette domain-containing protein [Cystobacter fuscus]
MLPRIIEIDHVSKSFTVRKSFSTQERIQALDDVSLPLLRGRTLAVVGESGSGKSTLARLLMRLDQPTHGSIRMQHEGGFVDIGGISPKDYYRRVQMVFQDPYSSMNPRKRIWQTVTTALSNLRDCSRDEMMQIAERQLQAVGLDGHYLKAFPHALSGGQRQRVCIARAIVAQPEILVLDEPLSALDVSIQAQILNLLLELQQRLMLTYLFITHDLAVVRHFADDVAVMYAGQLVEYGTVDAIIGAPRHPYTRTLVESSMPGRRKARVLSGDELDKPAGIRKGCNFLPRCAHAVPQCAEQRPLLKVLEDRSAACFLAEPVLTKDVA